MRIFVLAILGLVLSCANASLTGGSKDDSAGASPSSETGKPSEDTEGVPGYLVDPALVEMEAISAGVKITGKAGAIRKPADEAEAILSIFTAKPTDFADAFANDDDVLVATFKKSIEALADGSFVAEIEAEIGELVIVVAAASELAEVVIPDGAGLTEAISGLFAGSGGAFATLAKAPVNDDGKVDLDDETPTDGASGSGNCGGVVVGGACWYLAPDNTSCGKMCESHGGYDEATSTYAGDAGTLEQCYEVLDALGIGGINAGDLNGPVGVGCAAANTARVRWISAMTDASSVLKGYQRVCACRE